MTHDQPDGTVLQAPLDSLQASAANPRRELDQEAMKTLVESVRTHGILQPIIVRYRDDELEVVCGHRRMAAARAAGLETIPAILRHITSAEAFDLAMTENLQREDLTEIDEAEAYDAWRQQGATVEAIALKVGRSSAYVYQRLRLLALPEVALKALKDGRLPVAAAITLARIPDAKAMAKAAKELCSKDSRWGEPTLNTVKRYIEDNASRVLASAPFDTACLDLVPDAPACGTCPHRTGNQADLFGGALAIDVDTCLDTACFEKKVAAGAERRLAEARERGQVVLGKKEAKSLFRYGRLSGSSYVDGTYRAYEIGKGDKTYAQLMKKAGVEPVLAVDDMGAVREIYPRQAVNKALKQLGVTPRSSQRAESKPANQKAAAKEKERRELRDAQVEAVTKAVRGAVEAPKFSASSKLLKRLANSGWQLVGGNDRCLSSRGLDVKASFQSNAAIESWVDRASPNECLAFLIEILLDDDIRKAVDGKPADREAFGALFRLDLDKVISAAVVAAPEPAAQETAAPPSAKKPSRSKKAPGGAAKKSTKAPAKKARTGK